MWRGGGPHHTEMPPAFNGQWNGAAPNSTILPCNAMPRAFNCCFSIPRPGSFRSKLCGIWPGISNSTFPTRRGASFFPLGCNSPASSMLMPSAPLGWSGRLFPGMLLMVFANRFDGFGARFGDKHDGAPLKSEGFAEFFAQVFVVLCGKHRFVVHEQHEFRRNGFHLGGVLHFQEVAGGADRLPFFDRLLECPVQD